MTPIHLSRAARRAFPYMLFPLLAACGSVEIPDRARDEDWIKDLAVQRKDQAVKRAETETIFGFPAKDFLMIRCAMIFQNQKPQVSTSNEGSVMTYEVRASGSAFGTAVSVGDGYFLTAAHVLSGTGGWLVAFEPKPRAVRYRLVWSGKNDDCDLALIHAEVRTPALPLSSPERLESGQKLISFGFGKGRPAVVAGELISVRPLRREGDEFHDVAHSAPLEPGDSGGALVKSNGVLIGIHSRVDAQWFEILGRGWFRSRTHATLPDTEWLARMIEEDRKR